MIVDKKYRFENLEFRWDDSNYHPPYPEIVCWYKGSDEKEFCYTLALWVEDSEGWDLKFVGDRPFEYERVDPKLFWELAYVGNTIVNADWRMQRFMKERSRTCRTGSADATVAKDVCGGAAMTLDDIIKLARQAGLLDKVDCSNDYFIPAVTGLEEIKRFAALVAQHEREAVVRECAGIVADAIDHREPASTYASKIKEHFGVEE